MTKADIVPCLYIGLLGLAFVGCAKKKVTAVPPPPPASHDPYKDACGYRMKTGWNFPQDPNCQAKTFR